MHIMNHHLHHNIHLTIYIYIKKIFVDVICLLFYAGGKVEFREDLGSLSILKAH